MSARQDNLLGLGARRGRVKVALAALGLVLAGCLAAPTGPVEAPPAATRLLVLGDTGTGEAEQFQVAAAALRVCAARGCDAALILGDNIYETGVTSARDPQFEAKFERPYAAFDIPFYLVLGNHDNSGGPDGGRGTQPGKGDFQVRYALRDDRVSDRWHMPARYYDLRLGDVHLFGLDTTPITYQGLVASEPDPLAIAQEAWLGTGLAGSDARWKVVFAHHPYISDGQHGDAGALESLVEGLDERGGLKDFYEDVLCGAADVLLAGHDHDLQWLAPVAACGGTEFIVSGAGAKSRALGTPGRHEAYFEEGDILGFFWLEFRAGALRGAIYDGDGALRFERTLTKP